MSTANNHGWKRTASLIFKGFMLGAAFLGLFLNLGIPEGHFNIKMFNYFTIIANIMAFAYLLGYFIHFLRNRNTFDVVNTVWFPAFKYATLVSTTVTIIVAHFLLGGGTWFDDADNFIWATPIQHYIIPICFLLDWLIFDKKGSVKLTHVGFGLLMPIIYLAYVLIRVNVFNSSFDLVPGSRYPYSFLDLDVLPLSTFLTIIAALVVLFVVLGLIFYAVDRFLARRAALQ